MKRRLFGQIKQKRGRPGFYIVFTWPRGGAGRYYQRKGGARRGACDAKLRRIQEMLEAGTPVEHVLHQVFGDPIGPDLRFVDLPERYLVYAASVKKPNTVRNDSTRLVQISKESWARMRLRQLRPAHFRLWMEQRLRGGASRATVNRDLSLCSAVLKWAVANELATSNPVSGVKRLSEKGLRREVYLTSEEARRYVDAAREDYRPIAVTALMTGMRLGELLNLEWRDIDFAREVIRIRVEFDKSKRGREVSMGRTVREILRREQGTLNRSARVFRRADGDAHTQQTVKRRHREARDGARLPEDKRDTLRFHDLRHSAASMMVVRGVPIYDVAHVLGHQDVSTTMRYAHFQPELGRAAIEKLDQAMSGDRSNLRGRAE